MTECIEHGLVCIGALAVVSGPAFVLVFFIKEAWDARNDKKE